MRISDWSSDVCSSDLFAAYMMQARGLPPVATVPFGVLSIMVAMWMLSGSNGESGAADMMPAILLRGFGLGFLFLSRSEEHTSELQSLMRISYAVFCLKKKKTTHILISVSNKQSK